MATNSDSLRLGDQFHSYNELLARLNAFQQSTFTQLSRSATERLPETDELSALFKYRVLRYQCKQGHRCKAPSSTLQRPLQRSFKVGCPVMLNVRLNRPKGKDPFLRLTKLVLDHEGHEVSKENQPSAIVVMDSEYQRDGRLMDIIDEKWRADQLPSEDIQVPITIRPEPEQDNGPTSESLQEQEQKWVDLGLSSLNNVPPTSTQS